MDGVEGGYGFEASAGASVTGTVGDKNNNASAGVSAGNVAAGANGSVKFRGGNVKANACVKGALGVGAHACVKVTVPTKPLVNAAKKGGKKAVKTFKKSGKSIGRSAKKTGKSAGRKAKKAWKKIKKPWEDLQEL
jgi:hypothetical protein